MKISEDTIEKLNEQIFFILNKSQYFYQNYQHNQLIAVNIEQYYDLDNWQKRSQESFQKKTIQLFHYLLKELAYVTDQADVVTNDSLLSEKISNVIIKVYEILKNNNFEGVKMFHPQELNIEYKLIQFLITEIQLNVMINQSNLKNKIESEKKIDSEAVMEVEEDAQKSSTSVQSSLEAQTELNQLVFQFDKICRLLSVSLDETAHSSSLEEIIDYLHNHFQSLKQNNPDEYNLSLTLPKIFQHPTALTDQQKEILRTIQDVTFQDFQLRRQMLLKRFEVTIQTFLDKAAPSNSEQNNNATPPNNQTLDQQQIRLAIESQQQYLHNKPLFFEIEDALQAPFPLLIEHSQKITNQSHLITQKNKSIVKKVIIGKVPDRGGRVNELRPKRVGDFRSGGGGGQKFHGKRNAAASPDVSTGSQQASQGDQKHQGKNRNRQNSKGGGDHNQKEGRVVEIVGEDDNNQSSNNQHGGGYRQRKKGKREH